MWAPGASVRRAWQDLQGFERVYRGFYALRGFIGVSTRLRRSVCFIDLQRLF